MQPNEEDINKKQEHYRNELESLKRLIEEQLEEDGQASGAEGLPPLQPASDKNQAAQKTSDSASAAKKPETHRNAEAPPRTDVSRHQKLAEIKKQLEVLEKELTAEEASAPEQSPTAAGKAGTASSPGLTDTVKTVPAGGPSPAENQLFSLNTLQKGSSQSTTQQEALKIAQQQSGRQTQKEAAQIVERDTEPKKAEPKPNDAVPARQAPAGGGEDDIGDGVEEIYPKPKDTLFVFPDQSVSIVVKRKRSPLKLYAAAGLLVLIAAAGVAAYLVLGTLSKPAETSAPAPAKKEEPEVKMLRLEFPAKRSFGTLYDTSQQPASDTEWPPYADARGVVEYPDTMKLHLVVRGDHADDLSPLTKLPPRSLASLWLPSFDLSEKNLNALHSLERVSLIYIDQELTERERDQITEGFKGDVTVTSKIPGTIVRDMTPPNERTFNFPEGEAVGRLAIRRWNDPSAPWQFLDAARGEVAIPAKMEVQLQAASGPTDFSFLKDFDIYAIHTLILNGRHVTDRTAQEISVLKGLVALELINTRISSAGMEAISTIQGLQQIKIETTQLGDESLVPLRDLPQLATIEIVGAPNVTAESFKLFKKLRVLRRLHLQRTSITPVQLRKLEKDLPSCAITSF